MKEVYITILTKIAIDHVNFNIYFIIYVHYAINTVLGKIKSKTNQDIISTARTAYTSLSERTTVTLLWVPGHSKIWGNELADFLAKEGANGGLSRVHQS